MGMGFPPSFATVNTVTMARIPLTNSLQPLFLYPEVFLDVDVSQNRIVFSYASTLLYTDINGTDSKVVASGDLSNLF